MREFFLWSDDAGEPAARLCVDAERDESDDSVNITDEDATSRGVKAQTSRVIANLCVSKSQAAWIRDVLIALRLDEGFGDGEVEDALRRLADNPFAVTP